MPLADRQATCSCERWSAPAAWRDALVAATVTLLSAAPSLPRLGFYSDDWALLAGFANGGDSLLAWDRVTFPGRPVQAFYLTFLYRAFGFNPLGYHLVNAVVLAASAAMLCLLLVRLQCGRGPSFAAAVLLVMLPQLSTVRVWYAAFQVPLSMAFMLVSMHCQLSAARSGKFTWVLAAGVAAAISVLAYEIFAPLIAAFAVVLVVQRWRSSTAGGSRTFFGLALIAALVAAGFAVKLSSGRAGTLTDAGHYLHGARKFFRLDYDWHVDSGLNLFAAARVYFWAPVVGFGHGVMSLITGAVSVEVAIVAALIAGLVYWRLSVIGRTAPESGGRLLRLGLVALLLGNAIFLIVPAVVFTSTGPANRTQVAAAIGIAMIFAAILSLCSDAAFGRRARGFPAVMALVAAGAFARMSSVEEYWTAAVGLQASVLEAAAIDLDKLPPHSRVMLDGVCPYYGPSIVFETDWDVSGALTLALKRPITGDAVSPRMVWAVDGVRTSMDGAPSFYRYGPDLYVYDASRRILVQLSNVAQTRRYLATRPARTCLGSVQRGAEV